MDNKDFDAQAVTVGEFSRTMASFERQMAAGFRGLHKRLDGAENRDQVNGERLAALEALQDDCRDNGERLVALETLRDQGDSRTKRSAITWGGGVAGGVTGVLWLLDVLAKYIGGQ